MKGILASCLIAIAVTGSAAAQTVNPVAAPVQTAVAPAFSPELIQRLEARGVDVARLQQRMADNGRDGSAIRGRLESRGVDVEAAKARLQSGVPTPPADRRDSIATDRREMRTDASPDVNRAMWSRWFQTRGGNDAATIQAANRVRENRTPEQRRAAINQAMQNNGIDRSQWREQAAQMTPEDRASRRDAFRSELRSRRGN